MTSRPTTRPAQRLRTVALAVVLAATSFAVNAVPDPGASQRDERGSAPLPIGLGPSPANAAYCATPNPTFTGRLTQTLQNSGTPPTLSGITNPNVYAWISNVDGNWACTLYRRYSGWAWNTAATTGTFDWGTIINSTSVSCNWAVGSTDYLKANNTSTCSTTDSQNAMTITLDQEGVYQADVNHDSIGDSSFVHVDCDTTPYYGAEVVKTGQSFSTGNAGNRPGANCDTITKDASSTNTITYDATGPTLGFYSPQGSLAVVPSAFYAVEFAAYDAYAGFDATHTWTLSRSKASWNGTSCGTFAPDTTPGSTVTGTQNSMNQVDSQGLELGYCYSWGLNGVDRFNNVGIPAPSTTIVTDPSGVLGVQPQFALESWDLGGGDQLSVSTGSGNLLVSHPIVSLPIRGGSLDLGATYNSLDPGTVGMGPGWRLNVQRRLAVNANGSVTFTDETGARHTFTNPSGTSTITYSRPDTLYATLVRDTVANPDRFTLTYRDQSKDIFDEDLTNSGLLKQIKDRFGNTTSLAYTAGTARITTMTDPAGRTIAFSWDGSGRLTQIVDWANVSGGIVQTSGSGNRTHRFFYDGSGYLSGWADPLNTSGSCPTAASHRTCLTYAGGLLTAIAKTQTYETLISGNLGTSTRTVTTAIGYQNADVLTVTDGTGAATTFSHSAAATTKVVRPGTPASETTYTAVSVSDPLGRIASVKRKLGADWIETETTYDATYKIDPATIKENKGGGALERVTNYTYLASSLGLLSRLDEPLDGTYRRWTDSTYNANNDVTQTIVSRSGDTATDTVTRYCYTTSGCATSGTTLTLRAMIANYVDETPGGANGHLEDVTTTYLYDAYGQRTRETRANYAGSTLLDSAGTGWAYDTYGNQTAEIRNYVSGTVTNPGDDITPNATTNARTDLTATSTYDTAGNRVSVADPRRAIEAAKGTSLTADDFISRTTFDALGQAVTSKLPTTPGGNVCSPDPACRTTTTSSDEFGAVRLVTGTDGKLIASQFDQAGRTQETYEDPDGAGGTAARQTSVQIVDAQGRVTRVTDDRQLDDSSLGFTTTLYDELGRVTSVISADGGTPGDQSTTATTYDALDRVISQTTGTESTGAQTTTTGYDIGGRAISTNDEFTCETATFDYRDLPTQVIEGRTPGSPCSGSGTRTVTLSYDLLGRLTARTVGTLTLEANTYDGAGRVIKSWSDEGSALRVTETWSNPLDEPLETQRYLDTGGTKTERSWSRSTRDAAGNETDRCTWDAAPAEWCHPANDPTWATPVPVSRSSSTFDARNQRIRLLVPGQGETTYDAAAGYQPDNVYITTRTNGSGQVTAEFVIDHTYDGRDRLVGLDQSGCAVTAGTHSCTSTPVVTGTTAYTYDDAGNRTSVIENNGSGSVTRYYCYDVHNRLTKVSNASATCASGVLETYAYDAAGNRTQDGSRTFAYKTNGQLQSCTTGTCGTPAFDADGRLTAITLGTTQPWTYVYDNESRLIKACQATSCTGTPARLEMTYDAAGHRIRLVETTAGSTPTITTTDVTYQGDRVAQEVATTGSTVVTRAFTTDEAGAIVKMTLTTTPTPGPDDGTYLVTWNGHGDALGLARIDPATGELVPAARVSYTTWGKPAVTSVGGFGNLGFRYLYVGRFEVAWDDFAGAGLLYMHARHYHPEFGRFLQPDPSAAEANLYGYAENSPVTKVDPDGTAAVAAVAAAWCLLNLHLCASLLRAGAIVITGVSSALIGVLLGTAIAGSSVTANREWGTAFERAIVREYVRRFPHLYPQAPTVFYTPIRSRTNLSGKRVLDVCFFRAPPPQDARRAVFCVEMKTGGSRYQGTTQEAQDNWIRDRYGIPIIVRRGVGIKGTYR